jgi:DNA-binding transcriptional ArsR family regulator
MTFMSFDHFFTVLSNKQRVRILQLLEREGPLSVNAITERLSAEQSAVSHALKQLLLCHFVNVTQDGKERNYALNEDTVRPLLGDIERHVQKYCVQSCKHWS